MTKNDKETIIAAALMLILLALSIKTFVFPKQKVNKASEAPISEAEMQMMEDAQFIGIVRSTESIVKDQNTRWEQEWERDPFQLQEAVSVGGVENLVLNGVLWDDQNPRAVVNNKMLRIGQILDGYKLMEVRPASVVLWTGEKNLELRVFKSPEPPPAEET